MTQRRVRDRECCYTIADEFGMTGPALWEMQSDQFKTDRSNPGILAPRDVIETPDTTGTQPTQINQVNEFVVDRHRPEIGLAFALASAPLQNADGVVARDGTEVARFRTDVDGKATFEIPPIGADYDITLVVLALRLVLRYTLLVAEPDPLPATGTRISGADEAAVNQRLCNLGYGTGRNGATGQERVARDDALGDIVDDPPGHRRRALEARQHGILDQVHRPLGGAA